MVEVGDTVRCVSDGGYCLTKDRCYKVLQVFLYPNHDDIIRVIADDGNVYNYSVYRFTKV